MPDKLIVYSFLWNGKEAVYGRRKRTSVCICDLIKKVMNGRIGKDEDNGKAWLLNSNGCGAA